jgi:hypothetical protein
MYTRARCWVSGPAVANQPVHGPDQRRKILLRCEPADRADQHPLRGKTALAFGFLHRSPPLVAVGLDAILDQHAAVGRNPAGHALADKVLGDANDALVLAQAESIEPIVPWGEADHRHPSVDRAD